MLKQKKNNNQKLPKLILRLIISLFFLYIALILIYTLKPTQQ